MGDVSGFSARFQSFKTMVSESKIGIKAKQLKKTIASTLSSKISSIKENKASRMSFREEREKQSSLCDSTFIAKKILLRCGGDGQKALKLIEKLEKDDIRYNGESDGLFSVDLSVIKGELEKSCEKPKAETDKKVNNFVPKALKTLSARIAAKKEEKLKGWVGDQLVGLVQRNDVSHVYVKGSYVKAARGLKRDKEVKEIKITQQACRAETGIPETKLSKDKSSPSAELPKYERNLRTLPNTAALVSDSKVICFRSAKTHKAHLMEQRSKTDIAKRSEAILKQLGNLKKGEVINGLRFTGEFTQDHKPIFDYQPVIFTMMDSAFSKAVGTSSMGVAKRIGLGAQGKVLKSKSTPIENERKFLAKMKKANKTRFKNTSVIEHSVSVSNSDSTSSIVVREKPAIIQNHVFSKMSKDPDNLENARQENISGQMQMLKSFVENANVTITQVSLQSLEDGEEKKINLFAEHDISILANLKDKPSQEELSNIKECLIEAWKLNAKNTNPAEKEKINLMLEAFHANIFGTGLTGYSYNKEDSGADLGILTGFQSDYLGLAFSAQCKSGNDRTITATALKCASHAFFETTGRNFNPGAKQKGDDERFKKFYTASLVEFGFSNVEASRGAVKKDGKSGLKIAHSPAAFKYLNENDDDLKDRGHLI